MLRWVCSLIYHRGRHKAVGTSVTHSPAPSVLVLLFLPHYDFICGLSLNRPQQNGRRFYFAVAAHQPSKSTADTLINAMFQQFVIQPSLKPPDKIFQLHIL